MNNLAPVKLKYGKYDERTVELPARYKHRANGLTMFYGFAYPNEKDVPALDRLVEVGGYNIRTDAGMCITFKLKYRKAKMIFDALQAMGIDWTNVDVNAVCRFDKATYDSYRRATICAEDWYTPDYVLPY